MIDNLVISIEQQFDKYNFLNIDIDKWILISYLLLCIPFGFLFQKIRSPQIKLWYNLIIGIFFAMLISKEWFFFMNQWTLAIYILTKISNRCVLHVSIVAFALVSYVHIHRLLYDYLSWRMDYNTIQMMLTTRYIYYAVDISDNKVGTSFLKYCSYVYMFPNLVIAPIPYKNFVNLIFQKEDNSKYCYKPTFISLGKALLLSAGELYIRPYFDIDWYWTKEWENMNIIYKNLLNYIICICIRFPYHAGFKYGQAAIDAYGITYNPETQKCDRFPVSDYNYEIEKNLILKTQMWNSNVHLWLKYCFYDRISAKFGGSTFFIIFLISCLWQEYLNKQFRHGFYLSYYLFFPFWALTAQVCKYFYKAQRRFYFIPEKVRHFIAYIFVSFAINNMALGMKILDWDQGIKFQNSMYWWAQISVSIIWLFFFITQYGQRDRVKQKSL